HSNAAGDCDALDGSGSATAPGKSPLATSCSVDSYLGLVLLAKATSSHVSVLSLQKAIAFSVSTTVVVDRAPCRACSGGVRSAIELAGLDELVIIYRGSDDNPYKMVVKARPEKRRKSWEEK